MKPGPGVSRRMWAAVSWRKTRTERERLVWSNAERWGEVLMMISSALVSSSISAIETVFPPSNFGHSPRFETISIAVLTLTY